MTLSVRYDPNEQNINNRIEEDPERGFLSHLLATADRRMGQSINRLTNNISAFDTGMQNRIDRLMERNRFAGIFARTLYVPANMRFTRRAILRLAETYNNSNCIHRFGMVVGWGSIGLGITIALYTEIRSPF